MLWGLYTLGFDREANDFFYFIADVAAGKKELQIMYGIGGEHELTEKTVDHLSGYESSQPVRVGNAAFQQVQHDVWGAVLDSVYLHTKSRDFLPEVVWPILKRAVESARFAEVVQFVRKDLVLNRFGEFGRPERPPGTLAQRDGPCG